LGAGNALAAALRAARDHLVRLHPGEGATRDTEPYPLLLVRPQGLIMYDRARRAIEAGDFDFGFELVEADWNLKYPAADLQLAGLEKSAIDQARIRQQVLAEAAPRAYRNPTLAAAGEFEYDDEQTVVAPPGQNAYVVRRRQARDGGGFGSSDDEDGYAGAGRISGPGGESGDDNGDILGGGDGRGGVNRDGLPGSGYDGNGNGGSGYGGSGIGGGGPGGNYGPGGGAGAGATAGGPAGGGYPGGTASSGSVVPTGSSQGAAPGGSSLTVGNGGSTFGSGSSSPNGFGSEPPDNDRNPAPQRTDFADARESQPGMYQDPGPRHAPIRDADRDLDKKVEDPSVTRGKDWALRNKPGRAVPVRRTIRVVVGNNQVQIVPGDAPLTTTAPTGKTVPFKGDTVQSLDEFVAQVRKSIDDWGIAGENLYWRPVLVFSVSPDGQKRADDLTRLLKNSGLEISAAEVATSPAQDRTR
jgi:hypothetical protein